MEDWWESQPERSVKYNSDIKIQGGGEENKAQLIGNPVNLPQ